MDYVDDSLVDKLWHDLDGQVSRQQIVCAAREAAARFLDAKVTAFVPIFVHRRALEQLKGFLADPSRMAASSAQANDGQRRGRDLLQGTVTKDTPPPAQTPQGVHQSSTRSA